MIFKAVETFLPHADKIILSGVPGKPGEMTRSSKGQVLTSRLDNSDTMHIEIMDEISKQTLKIQESQGNCS